MDYRNAKRLLDGYIEDTRGIAFSAYTSLTRGASRHGGGADWKDGKRIRLRVPSKDRVKVARNTWLERGWSFDISSVAGHGHAAGSIRSGDKLRYPENSIGVRFHDTYIVILTPHWTELNTGGWATMSTRDRIDSFSPVQIGASRGGWAVYLYDPAKPCFCVRDAASERASSNGIVIRGEHEPGQALDWTGEFDPSVESLNENGAPIYEWRTCQHCHGTEVLGGFDFDSGGHPYFDGIRVSPDGTRLMRTQPNRSDSFEPVRTISGITGEGLGRWRATYYGGYSA